MKVELRNLKEVMDALRNYPADEFERAKKIFAAATLDAQTEVERNLNSVMQTRSGMLKRSINTSVTGTDMATLKASLFSKSSVGGKPVIYAPVHEYGATIKAIDKYKKVPGGPYLNIPLPGNNTAAGVTRLQAREVFKKGKKSKDNPKGWVIFQSKKGNWLVALKGVLMFVLVKQVKIPARLGMRDAADNQIPTLLQRLSEF